MDMMQKIEVNRSSELCTDKMNGLVAQKRASLSQNSVKFHFYNFLIYLDIHLLLGSWFGVWTGLDSQIQNGYCVIVFLSMESLELERAAASCPLPKTKTTTNGHAARISARPRASSLLLAPLAPLASILLSFRTVATKKNDAARTREIPLHGRQPKRRGRGGAADV